MSTNTQILIFEKNIRAPISQIYHAITNSSRLREWMCDLATTDPKPNGRLYLAWNGGFYSCGHFTSLEKNKSVGFTWYGRGEPRNTQVNILLTPVENGVHLRLEHSGLGEGDEWDAPRRNFTWGWENGLENLVSILETGSDLRIVRRPMLGILVSDFNAEIARKMNLPITEGIRLSGVVAGLGAEAAGLKENDVVTQVGRFPLIVYADISTILSEYKAGDDVEVTYYRTSIPNLVTMKLSSRSLPQIPGTPKELAQEVDKIYAPIRQQLEEIFAGITEEQASHHPAEDEWSAIEVLAHLIHGERGLHNNFQEIIGSYEPLYDGYENLSARITATIQAHRSASDLLRELIRLMQETVYFIENIPVSFIETKSSYWRLAFIAMNLNLHMQGHIEQLKSSLNIGR